MQGQLFEKGMRWLQWVPYVYTNFHLDSRLLYELEEVYSTTHMLVMVEPVQIMGVSALTREYSTYFWLQI